MYLIFIIQFEHLLNKFVKISRHQLNKCSKITLVFSQFHFGLESWSDGDSGDSGGTRLNCSVYTSALSQQICWVAVDLIPAR